MQAIVYDQYGGPEKLYLKTVETPQPSPDEILVKIQAIGLNPADWRSMRADPFIARFESGLFRPKQTLGSDFSGHIEAIGSEVTGYQVGDAVFGNSFEYGFSAFAEYISLPTRFIIPKPAAITHEAAAATPLAALTALQGLRAVNVQSGQCVLINGASGGVGTFAIQLAKLIGAEVTGVCSTANLELVQSLGADHTIDYSRQDFATLPEKYDAILDLVGNRSASDLRQALKPNGQVILIGLKSLSSIIPIILHGLWISKTSSKSIKMLGNVRILHDDLKHLADLLSAQKLQPVIEKSYAFSDYNSAMQHLETGRVRGKLVLSLP